MIFSFLLVLNFCRYYRAISENIGIFGQKIGLQNSAKIDKFFLGLPRLGLAR